jgi:putative ABC transport system substrate-binding protein
MVLALGPREQEALEPLVTLASRILKGENPAVLPVDQASKVYLVVNLRAAQKLGITVPPSILARADRIVQ